RNPRLSETKNSRTLERVRGVLNTPSGCGFLSCQRIPGVRKKRVPLANFLAPLRGATDYSFPKVRISFPYPAVRALLPQGGCIHRLWKCATTRAAIPTGGSGQPA